MKIKRVVTFLVIGILFLNPSIPAFAEMSSNVSRDIVGAKVPITPQWTNTNDVKLDLYFVNGKAECVGIINGYLVLRTYLQHSSWSVRGCWVGHL